MDLHAFSLPTKLRPIKRSMSKSVHLTYAFEKSCSRTQLHIAVDASDEKQQIFKLRIVHIYTLVSLNNVALAQRQERAF